MLIEFTLNLLLLNLIFNSNSCFKKFKSLDEAKVSKNAKVKLKKSTILKMEELAVLKKFNF